MKVLVPLVEGFEELEAVAIVDILRRAGIETHTIGLVTTLVEGAHKIKISSDFRLSEVTFEEYDVLVLPGGDPGYKNLMNSSSIISMIRFFNEHNRLIGAICAAPLVLAKAGALEGKRATIFPTMEKQVPNLKKGTVVSDKNIVTASGPGHAVEFSLKLVELISGKEKAEAMRAKLVLETEAK